MTRLEAKNDLYQKIRLGLMRNTTKISDFIDTIYDDFESRICESCKWYEEYPSVCCNADCPLCADVVPSDYGCKYWEAKDVNQNTK